jgi:hypothetical protein
MDALRPTAGSTVAGNGGKSTKKNREIIRRVVRCESSFAKLKKALVTLS